MEKWQSDHILRNIPKLIESTDCSISFLVQLQSENILNDEDLQIIESERTKLEKSHRLFKILPTRKKSFKALISALQNTSQSGAVEILVAGFILHGSINFQGKLCSIPALLPNLDSNSQLIKELTRLQLQQPFIDANEIVKNTIPCKSDYYIPRTIETRGKLDKLLFQEKYSDVFLFQGLEWNKLSLLAKEFPTDVSSNLLNPSDQLHTRFILLESIEHWDNIVNKTTDPVHLIQHSNGEYQWIKSQGTVQTFQKFVEKTSESTTEECFVERVLNDHISVCLTDSPGMGKTVLLANLARAIISRNPTRLVIFVVLREFVPALQSRLINETQLDSQLIQTLLSECGSDHPFGRHIVSYKLINDKTHLFFDGFDEVLPEQRQLTKDMLKVIAKKLRNCQTFVTARLHMREELEQTLGTLSFYIAPFNLDNQIEFLTKFWKSHDVKTENKALKKYAGKCLTNLANQMSEGEQDIAGIPLQCCMIGEVFLVSAKCSKPNLFFGAKVTLKSMAQLYRTLINMKLDAVKCESSRESLIQAHIYSAMTLLFPNHASNFVKYSGTISNEQLCRAGIMEQVADIGSNGQIRFVHRTFAEYFVGLFAVTLLQNRNMKEIKFVLKKILATYGDHDYLIDNPLGRECYLNVKRVYQHPVIAYFINFLLREQNISFISNLHIKLGRHEPHRSVLAAVSHGSVELLNLYFSLCSQRKSKTLLMSEVQWSALQFVAAKHSELDMLQKCFELSKKNSLVSNELQPEYSSQSQSQTLFSPLYVACYKGNYRIVEYLVQSNLVNLDKTLLALHFCMWYSSFQPEAVIKRKIEIIKYLSQSSGTVLHNKLRGLTPILGKQIHLELLKCALESGASVHDRDTDLKSLLHLHCKYMTADDYHGLVMFLGNSFCSQMLAERDVFECTPLHYAVQYLPILSETLEIFLTHGADINSKDKDGNSVLFYALRHQNEATLELLGNNGANLNDENLALETASQVALKHSNSSAVEWLSQKRADIKASKSIFAHIQHKANLAMTKFQNALKLKNLLASNVDKGSITNGEKKLSFADIHFTVNNEQQFVDDVRVEIVKHTALHTEFCQPNVDIEKIKFQFQLHADFNARNVDGNTPLHVGVMRTIISKEVLDFAVKQGGADLNLVNHSGLSVLGQAIFVQRDISFLKLLVEYGADVCRLKNFIAAISSCNLLYVKFLLEHGADILEVSREGQDGDSPISLALLFHEKANFKIAKCLLTSTPQLVFDDQNCITNIVFHALRAYQKSSKFRTVELLNLMASRGLNFAHCHTPNQPLLFVVISVLSSDDCKLFVTHLNASGLKEYFLIQDEDECNLLFHCAFKFEMDKEFLSLFNANEVDFNLKDKSGCSILWYAINRNYTKESLSAIIFFGADPYVLDETGNNLLFTSIFCQQREVIGLLVNTGISLHSKNNYGVTPYLHACYTYIRDGITFDTLEFVSRLADLNKLNGIQVFELYLSLPWIDAPKYDVKLVEVIKLLKLYELNLTSYIDDDGGTPAFFKVVQCLGSERAENFLNTLVQAGYINLGEIKNIYSANVVQYFIGNSKTDFPINLIPMLGDVHQILNSCDNLGWNVLTYAILCHKSVNYIDKLIECGANINHFCGRGMSLLHYAACTGDTNCAEVLVDKVNDKNCVDYRGCSALHYAFDMYTDKHYNVAKLLISKGVSVNLESFSGLKIIDSSLRAYKQWGYVKSADIFTLMLSHGLDIASKCRLGSPILFKIINILSEEHCEEVLKYLYHNNQVQYFHLCGHYGDTVLHRCVQNFEPSAELLQIFKLVGADFNAKDMLGNSVLFYAVLANRTKSMISNLISHGANWKLEYNKYQ